jgi:hypothetical protein
MTGYGHRSKVFCLNFAYEARAEHRAWLASGGSSLNCRPLLGEARQQLLGPHATLRLSH